MKRVLLFLLSASSLMANDAITALVRTQKGYNLQMSNVRREIKSYDVDSRLKSLDNTQLKRMTAIGCLKAHEMNNGDYRVEIGGGLKGGGPITAGILYWVTKIGCYGTAAAATTTIAAATAGTGIAAVGGFASTLAAASVAGGAGVGAPIAGLVAGTIANTALASEAAIATAGVITSAGSFAGAVAAVESASMGAFAFGMMLPLP
jgi:hypothetical protein